MKLIIFVATIVLAPALPVHGQEADDIPLEKMSGAQIYKSYCSRCHGDDGRGNIDPEILEGLEAPPPDFTEGYFSSREKRKDWQVVTAHGGGVRGLSMSMPAWGEALTEQQIAETVEYIKGFADQSLYPQGELNFFRGHRTTKAFVEQEALIIPSHQFRKVNGVTFSETQALLYYANRFGNRFQYELKAPLIARSAAGANDFGIGDVEVGLKYAFYDNYKSLTIFTAGLEAGLPTGSESKGYGAGTVVAVPYIAAGQGVGKHLQLSSSFKLEIPFDAAKGHTELRSSLLAVLVTGDSKQGFFPGVEFYLKDDLSSASYSLSIIPQMYWGITPRGHLAFSLGYEIPVAGTKPFDGRIAAFFLWDYVDGGLWW